MSSANTDDRTADGDGPDLKALQDGVSTGLEARQLFRHGTYTGFMTMLKYSIIALLLIVLALYCFIVAGQPLLGTLLLLVIPVGAVGLVVMGSRRS